MKHDIKGGLPKDGISGPALSAQQAAEYLGISLRQVQIFEEQGRLPFFRISEGLMRTRASSSNALNELKA